MHLRVGLLQMAACGPQKQDLLAKGEAYCRQAAAMGADIALFPELWYISDHHFVDLSWSNDYKLWRGKHLWSKAERHPGQEFAEQIQRWHAQHTDSEDSQQILVLARGGMALHPSGENWLTPEKKAKISSL